MATALAQGPPLLWLQISSSNYASRGAVSRRWVTTVHHQSFGKPIHVALSPSGLRRTTTATRLGSSPNDEEQEKNRQVVTESDDERKGIVEKIEEEMGRQFGGVLWFTVLLVCLAFFGGAYVYYIVNYANFDDIPILRGPAS